MQNTVNTESGISYQSHSTLILDKLMDLDINEPIPNDLIQMFRKKFPEKRQKELHAYIMGYYFGLQPNGYDNARQFLETRKR